MLVCSTTAESIASRVANKNSIGTLQVIGIDKSRPSRDIMKVNASVAVRYGRNRHLLLYLKCYWSADARSLSFLLLLRRKATESARQKEQLGTGSMFKNVRSITTWPGLLDGCARRANTPKPLGSPLSLSRRFRHHLVLITSGLEVPSAALTTLVSTSFTASKQTRKQPWQEAICVDRRALPRRMIYPSTKPAILSR